MTSVEKKRFWGKWRRKECERERERERDIREKSVKEREKENAKRGSTQSWKQRESNLSATENKLALFYALSHKVRAKLLITSRHSLYALY
jgi:hypothetical protein